MKRLAVTFILFFAVFRFTTGYGQQLILPSEPDTFKTSVVSALNRTQMPRSMDIAASFEATWAGLSSDFQDKIIVQVQEILNRGMNITPHVASYLEVVNNAVNLEGIDNNHFTQYFLMTQKVIEAYNPKDIQNYFKVMARFFAHHALYHSTGNKLYVFNDDYSMAFEGDTGFGQETEALGFSEQTEDGNTEEVYNYEEENTEEETDEPVVLSYEEFLAQSGYTEESADGNSSAEENFAAEPEVFGATFVKPEVIYPEAYGPVIRFNSADLNFATYYDSAFIEKTSGYFLIDDQSFTGEGGSFKWTSAGIDNTESMVTLNKYTFDTREPHVIANEAVFSSPDILKSSPEGIFEFKSIRHDSTTKPVYPRFISYTNDVDYAIYDDPSLKIKGGFHIRGKEITTENFAKGKTRVSAQGNPGFLFISRGYRFHLRDSTILSSGAGISIIHKRDSIFHPSAKVRYETKSKKLHIYKPDNYYEDAPFVSSFLNLNFLTENIVWDLNYDSLNFYIKSGQQWQPMVFESVNHFAKSDYQELGGVYKFHPIGVIGYYSNKYNLNEFALSSLTSDMNMNFEQLEAAVIALEYKGLLYYNRKNGTVTVTPKLRLLRDANFQLQDYDDIIFQSQLEENPGGANATMYLEEEKMEVRGVEFFEISDSLNVIIEPDSGRITLMKNRGIEFNGQISAGNFEFNGKDFLFKYDSFLVNLGVIDSVKFYTVDESGNRSAIDNSMVGLDSAAASVAGIDNAEDKTSGTLYINNPQNKSALQPLPNYPNFNAGMGGVIYFDRPEIFNGVYDKSIFFVVPPFDIDSLSNSDPSSIQFEGVFSSGGMFPDFDEKLEHQYDNSLGFEHLIPEEGYQLYEGSGNLYGDLRLNKGGIQSNGKIDFLSTTLLSERFVFYPDSVTGEGFQAEIREEEHNGITFPQATLSNYSMKWLPRKDSMYISNVGDPFQFYNKTASLDGSAIISNDGVFGSGSLSTKGSLVDSKRFTFKNDRFLARNAQFSVSSSNPEKPALGGDNVRLNFNLVENYADISPEIEGEAVISFPFAQFKTSIPSGRWLLDEDKVYMNKPDDVPLSKSYFYTTNEELDSLNFNATSAVYDINSLELKVSGIPFITVADAKITPDNNEVLILENSKIGTLTNTEIILDTLNAYHKLYDGVINIKSRNEFSGYATYELVNAIGDTFAIKMQDFRLEEFVDPESKKGDEFEMHTVANGEVLEEENILMSPGMFFKGDVKLVAHRQMLELDGYLKLNLLNRPGYDTWIVYKQNANQEIISLDFDNGMTETGRALSAGLYFNSMDNSLYSIFIEDPINLDDEIFFRPSGQLFYDEETSEFVIQDPEKAAGEKFSGKVFKYNQNTGDIQFEGPVNFFQNTKDAKVKAAISGTGNLQTSDFNLNSFITFDFNVPNSVWDLMAVEINEVITNLGAPEGLGDPTQLLYKVAEIMGEENTKAYEQRTLEEYVPLAGFTPEVSTSMVFADINLKWSDNHMAFYSDGLLGLSNILGYDLNGAFEGFLEFKKNEDATPVMNLFLKASADSWYYFGFEDNRLLIYSNNEELNNVINEKTNSAKAKIGEMVWIPGSQAETLEFIDRFRSQYYGIDEPYKLNAKAVLEPVVNEDKEEDKKEEVEEEDDGF